jgi:hypothetical protein
MLNEAMQHLHICMPLVHHNHLQALVWAQERHHQAMLPRQTLSLILLMPGLRAGRLECETWSTYKAS